MLDSLPRCDLGTSGIASLTHHCTLSPLAWICQPRALPFALTAHPRSIPDRSCRAQVEATLAGRTQAWWAGDLGSSVGPASDKLQNLGRTLIAGLSFPTSEVRVALESRGPCRF